MRAYNMNRNPTKCAFGVSAGKFLRFMVTQRGIKVNLDQIRAVMEMSALSNKKELQCLTSCLAALGCFITRFIDKLRFFFLTLKEANTTIWMNDYERAFEEIKRYLTQPPILSNLELGEQLYMYLVVFDYAVSAVLFHHLKDKEQRPVYYVNKTMVDVETQYSKME